jgi:FKBP-type peptidyl-prolyl cis-trans isomerase
MPRWMTFAVRIAPALLLAGCLPPVQETTDTTPAATAEAKAAATEQPTTATPAAPSMANSTPDAKGFLTTPSGLKYKVVRPGSDKKPTPADTVLCHYKGWLDNGTVFDSSYDRGEPIDFPLGGVIAGWTEGLQLIGEGGELELEIPSDLGYGPRGMPPTIPGGATLHFKVELIKVM